MQMKKNSGFTLIELSIVILIIGIIFTGVVSGTKLLEQAKLRQVIREFEEIKTAYKTFVATYEAVPGDMRTASAFFPNCGTSGSNEICNGNGDSYITYDMGNSNFLDQSGDEPARTFVHLNRAGIYDKGGLANIEFAGSTDYANPDYHAKSDVLPGGYYIAATPDAGFTGGSNSSVPGTIYNPAPGPIISNFPILSNAVFLFSERSAVANSDGRGMLTPFQSYQIDQKIDDGRTSAGNPIGANTGSFRAIGDLSGVISASNVCVNGNIYLFSIETNTCVGGVLLE